MSEVQRWSWADARDGGMWEYDAGEYVKHADYAAMAARCAEIESKSIRLVCALNEHHLITTEEFEAYKALKEGLSHDRS